MSTKHLTLAQRLGALGGALLALTALVTIALLAGQDSLAKGMITGGATVLVITLALWWRGGARGGMAGRWVNGQADERDDRILTAALADSAFAMGIAGVGTVIGAAYGLPAIAVAGIILWTGVITVLASAAVRSR